MPTPSCGGAKEATCTEEGYTGDVYCADCGKLLEIGQAIPAFCPSEKFEDVDQSRWYHEGVDFVVRQGYMNGVSEAAFAPMADMTRGQIVAVLYRMAGSPEYEASGEFADVAANAYYAKAVAWAVDQGIVKGYGDGTFRPNDVLSRQDLAVLLYRYAVLEGRDVSGSADLSGFVDAGTVSGYAREAIAWAVDAGLIQGVGNNTLLPTGTANRATVAVIVSRYWNMEE